MRIKRNILISLPVLFFFTEFCFSQREYPPCQAFQNGNNDTISAISSYSNTLYVGIDNVLEINKNIIRFPFQLSTNNGIIYEDNSIYYIMPSKSGISVISIFSKANIDAPAVFKKTFKVKILPPPQLSLCDLLLYEIEKIDRKFLLACEVMDVYYTDDLIDSNNWLKIIRFSLGYSYGSFFIEHASVSKLFTNQMKNLVRKIPPGQDLIIGITCMTQDNIKIVLPSCNLKVY